MTRKIKKIENLNELIGNVSDAQEFSSKHFPEELLEQIDLNGLKLKKESYITSKLKDNFSDLIFSTKFGDHEGYICFLFEHEIYLQSDFIYQLFFYILDVYVGVLKQKKVSTLPVIHPIVLHHGERPWYSSPSFGTTLPDYRNHPLEQDEFIPEFHYTLYDLAELLSKEAKNVSEEKNTLLTLVV